LTGRHPGPAGPVRVAARPEAWRLRHCSHIGLAGTVMRRSYLGRTFEYLVQTSLGRVLVHAPAAGLGLEAGAPVTLQLGARGVWVTVGEQLSGGFREEAVIPL
jgi:iron(III) transport system ATP-binding protein